MYGIPDSVKPLSAAEEQVMLAVWACRAPVTRRDIDAKLRAKGWAPATVLNFLYRLEEKGWVKSGKDGNRNTYTPAITQRAYNVWSMRERLDTLFGGDLAAALLRSAGIYQLVNDGHHFVFDKRSALKKHFAHGKYLTVREIFAIFVVQQISAARAVVYDLLSEAYAC